MTFTGELRVTYEITEYMPFIPMDITGTGFGDCDMPQPEYVCFNVLHNGEVIATERDVDRKTYAEVLQIVREGE